MKIKTMIIALAVGLAILGLFVWGFARNGNTAASVQGVASVGVNGVRSSFEATDVFYDFGSISMKDGNVSKDFIFTNKGNGDAVITDVQTSCMCTSALLVGSDGSTKGPFGMAGMGGVTKTSETVRAGESRTLRVIYDPNAHGPAGVGQIDRFVTVTDSTGGKIRFEIKALVKP